MTTTARMGRKKLGRRPFNLTMPKAVSDTAMRTASDENRTASALVEELLRAHFRRQGVAIVEDPAEEKPVKRKGAK